MALRRATSGCLLALGFLTRIPVPASDEPEPAAPGRAMAWFPLVGLLIGAALAVVRWGAAMALGLPAASALTLAAWVAITGGLHLDGALDCFDALVLAAPAERRLAVLKDVHVGSYGVVGAILLLLIKWLAIAEAPWPALLAAPVLGRMALVYVTYAFAYARPSGMGRAFKEHLGARQVAAAAITALACALILGAWRGALVAGISWLAAWAVGAWAARQLGGGITGDVYGLACEVVEVVALLSWGAWYA